jgi:uncharacterized protein (UPF0332 family)
MRPLRLCSTLAWRLQTRHTDGGHDWVHARFVGQLIQRRKVYPTRLRRSLPDLLALRHTGDYRVTSVSQRDAQQAVRHAQAFVQAVTAHLQGEQGAL